MVVDAEVRGRGMVSKRIETITESETVKRKVESDSESELKILMAKFNCHRLAVSIH